MRSNFLKRWFGKRPGTIRNKAKRRDSFFRLRVEQLEERVMLDAGLPSAIAVGKTLSAYSVADVQNHQETITYTVYNEQADTVHGVLLTDTLQAGVNFRSASQLPDQASRVASGPGDLAWSLGDIPGFGRASVDLTVSLDDPISLPLDSVTQAFGTLNAQMVSAEAPASLLRPYAIPGDLLASTPDANWNDPFIQQKAAELGYDPARIFDYLHDEVGYNSYNGSLRGARGTLWSSAGNSLDVASLGVALMRASGISAQYVSGNLSEGQAQQLILSMFPESFQTVGYIPAGTEAADPAHDPKLLAETENHYWFQFDIGNGMQDADPLMAGAHIGQTFTGATGTFTEVPDNLREKTEVKLTAEVYYQSDAAFGLDPFHRTVVLDQTFNDVDLVGRPLSIGNFVSSNGVGSPVFGVVTNTYSPYVVLGDEAFASSQAETVRGTDYQEQLTNFPLGNQILSGLFLDVTLSGPGGPAETSECTLVDRLGYAARQGNVQTTVSVAVDPTDPTIISPFDITTLNVLPGFQNRQLASVLQERYQQELSAYSEQPLPTDGSATNLLMTEAHLALSAFSAASDQLQGNLGSLTSVRGYFDRPRITIFSSRLISIGDESSLRSSIDLKRDSIRALAFPGQNVQANTTFRSSRGLIDSVLETQILEPPEGAESSGALQIIQRSIEQGSTLAVLTADNITLLQGFNLAPEAKARIVAAIQNGANVIVPTQSVTMNGSPTTAWIEENRATGEMIGVLQNGTHGFEIGEYGITIQNAVGRVTFFLQRRLLVTNTVRVRILVNGSEVGTLTLAKNTLKLILLAAIAELLEPGVLAEFQLFNTYREIQVYLLYVLSTDPPLPPWLSNLNVPFPRPFNPGTIPSPVTPVLAAGTAVGSGQFASVALSNEIAARWATTATSSFQARSLSAVAGTVYDGSGNALASGAVALATLAAAPVSISGNDQYGVDGTGSLSFYGPAETSLGVSGNWDNYTASVTGNVTITLTTDAMMLDGVLLPPGTYTITTSAATLSGSGLTTSPNFSGSVSIDATNATIDLGPGTGNVTLGGSPVDPGSGMTLTGYTGNITVAGNATDLDAVTLNGNAGNVLSVSAVPAALVTDQNTPVTFQLNVNTSLADTYNLTVQAPDGWTVSIDAAGMVTATPAPGLQSGTFAIKIIAQSATNPDLVAQTTVNVTITPTVAGMTLAVQPDSLITVPFNDAQVPTAFQAVIHNTGPAADTFNLSFANIPAGFTLLKSGTSVTIPAGETGIVGVYLQATTTLPAPGTPLSFDVTATSASNPAITHTVTESFNMPVVDGVTITANPPQVTTTPGGSTTTTITLHNVGNVPETVGLAVRRSGGLNAGAIQSIELAVGQTVTQTITLYADSAAALNNTLTFAITATYGPAANPQEATASVALLVRSPETVAVSQAAIAAGQVPNLQLAATLSELADAVAQVQATPTDASLLARVQFLLGNLSTLLSADPALTPFVASLQPLQASAAAGDGVGLVAQLAGYFGILASTLAIEATQKFTVSLSTKLIDEEPGQSKDFTVQLVNTGDDPVTLNLSAAGLPNNVTASFSQTQVTLPAGATQNVTVTVANTLVSAMVFTLEITAAASVVQHKATTAVSILPAVADVLDVTVNPGAVDSGDPVAVTAKLFNVANVARSVLAHLDILDTANHVVSTLPDVPVNLAPGSGLVAVDLGQVATAGLANGIYSVRVSLRLSDGSPLAGQAAQASLVIGPLVAATIAASAAIVPPGTSTVDTTITVSSPADGAGNPTPTQSHIVYLGQDPTVHWGFHVAPATWLARSAVRFAAGGPSDPSIGIIEDGIFPGMSSGDLFSLGMLRDAGFSDLTDIRPEDLATADLSAFQVLYFGPTESATDIAYYQAAVPNIQSFLARGGGLVVEPEADAPNAWSWVPHADQLGAFDAEQDTAIIVAPDHPAMAGLSSDALSNWHSSSHVAFQPDPSAGFTTLATDTNGNPIDLALVLDATASPLSIFTQIQHDLPASGYSVNVGSISPAADTVTSTQVAWQATFPPDSSTTSQFQLSGQVADMAPGEVRQISLGTTVDSGITEVVTTHSLADFSGTQGQGGWYYGYYATPGDTASFTQMPIFDGYYWRGDTIPPMLWSFGSWPGTTQWTVRRWVSDVTGSVTISGRASPFDFNTGDGIVARAFVDGVQVWAHTFGRFDTSSSSFQLTQSVHVGSTIDFVVDPRDTNNNDPMTFTASISRTRVSDEQTLHLPALTVAAEHIISLDQAAPSADRGGQSSYTLQLKNPYATDQTYLLSSDGLAGLGNNLPASVFVPAGQTVTVPLVVSVPPAISAGDRAFQIFATTAAGATDSVEGRLTVSPDVVLNSLAVHVALLQTAGTAGQGTPAIFTLRITNEGDAVDTYNLSAASLPPGVTAVFSQSSVVVPPGQSNFRDVTVTLTPGLGATPGTYPFEVSAASATNASVTATANGILEVLANGVSVALTPDSDAPGSTFQMTVTNTGQVADTFDLRLAGPAPAFFVGTSRTSTVSLAPGESQVFPITTEPVSFADPGALSLVAMATSQANPAVKARASANLNIPITEGMTAEFAPAAKTLTQPGPASFLLLVHNTGNTEDAYTATIKDIGGPITASLIGLDGQPTQTIPVFRLPGLFTGAILLQTNLTAPGQGSVTVEVRSLSNGEISASATAILNAPLNPTVVPTVVTVHGGSFTYDGLAHPATGSVAGVDGADLGTPEFAYTNASNVTTTSPPVNAGTYTVMASFAGNASYAAASSTETIVITPATPTVVVTDAGGTYTGGALPASATVTGVGSDSTLASSPDASLTFTYYVGGSASGAGSSTAPVNAGTYTVVAHFAGSGNYFAADSVPVTFNITRATPTVTVTDVGRTYNGSAFPAIATATGVGSDGTLASSPDASLTFTYYVGGSASGAGSSTAPVNAGTYTVVAHYAGNGNYFGADSAAVVFNIAKATPTVTVTDVGGTYNGRAFPASATARGVGNDGTLASSPNAALTFTYYVGGSASGAGSSTPPVNAGTYTVVAHYAGNGNYFGADSAAVTFNITKATATVTVSGGTFTYDGQAHPATGSVVGIGGVNLGTPTFAYTDASNVTTSNPPVNAGAYAVMASFAGNANYAPASKSTAIIITGSTKSVGILLLDSSGKGALTNTGNGSISVTGGGAIVVNSSNSQAAIVTGNGKVSAAEIDVTGSVTTNKGSFQGVIKQSAPPTADPLGSVPQLTPAMFVTVSTSTLNVTGNRQVTLQPGRYVGGIKISGQAHVTLAAGVYYLDGGGFSVSGQATVESAGGVLIFNAPRSSSDTLSFTGQGNVTLTGWQGNLSGLATGVSLDNAYMGIAVFQDRTSSASINLTGQGNVTITGSVYAASAAIKVTGNGSLFLKGDPTKSGAHLIASDLQVTGNGGVNLDASNNNIAVW